MINKKEFKTVKYIALCCRDNIHSSYEGEFVRCKCGNGFVDQTSHYTRIGGLYIIPEEEFETILVCYSELMTLAGYRLMNKDLFVDHVYDMLKRDRDILAFDEWRATE